MFSPQKEAPMLYILSGIFIIVLFLMLSFSGCGKPAGSSSPGITRQGEVCAAPQAELVTQSLSREELESRLKKLQESPLPSNLKIGAECYKVAMPPDRAEYLCPACGERTLYASDTKGRNADARFITQGLPQCRRLIKEIKGLNVSLDESEFCRKCRGEVKHPSLVLLVNFRGGNAPYRCKGITAEDLILVREFIEGKDRHQDSYDCETPLKEHARRLHEILGVK
jgi:hypothetical protein